MSIKMTDVEREVLDVLEERYGGGWQIVGGSCTHTGRTQDFSGDIVINVLAYDRAEPTYSKGYDWIGVQDTKHKKRSKR